jgi:hypothetical protein
VVIFAGQERLRFKLGDVVVRGGEFPVQLFQQIVLLFRVGLFLRKLDVRLQVARDGGEPFVCGNLFLGALTLAENALRRFLIAPEIGIGYAGFESFQALAILGRVKDSSARA